MDKFSQILILCALLLVVLGVVFSLLIFWPGPKAAGPLLTSATSSMENRQASDFFNIMGEETLTEKNKSREAALMFVGDLMLSRRVGAKAVNKEDWRWPFLKITDYLQGADLLFGNLESVISDKGRNVGSQYSFRAEPRMLEGLTFAGFDVLCLANNHVGDWTRTAFEDTMSRLTGAGIDYVGAGWNFEEAHEAVIRQAGNAKIGFLGYTDLAPAQMKASSDKSGIAWLDLAQMKQDVASAKTELDADLVVVSMHQGVEYAAHPNKYQKDFAHAAIDAGANLVVGHHSHVIQDLENYRERWIAYSLGNFIFDQDFSEETMHGRLLKVIIRDKEIISVEPIDIFINKDFQPAVSIPVSNL